jgi:hypothetical protein
VAAVLSVIVFFALRRRNNNDKKESHYLPLSAPLLDNNTAVEMKEFSPKLQYTDEAEYDKGTGAPLNNAAEQELAQIWQTNQAPSRRCQIPYRMLCGPEQFSPKSRIGGGASSTVYRTVLFGISVAVKVLNDNDNESIGDNGGDRETKQFIAEMECLQVVVHPNICRLLAVRSIILFCFLFLCAPCSVGLT